VSEQATKVKEKGRMGLREQLNQRTNDVGRQTKSLAGALRRAGGEADPLASDTSVERVTSSVAYRREQAGGYLEHARSEDVLRDAERLRTHAAVGRRRRGSGGRLRGLASAPGVVRATVRLDHEPDHGTLVGLARAGGESLRSA
jgi:hypothetical protein